MKLLLWLLLLIFAWPLALLALILYPLFWLLSIPFRLIGISVRAVSDLLNGSSTCRPGRSEGNHRPKNDRARVGRL